MKAILGFIFLSLLGTSLLTAQEREVDSSSVEMTRSDVVVSNQEDSSFKSCRNVRDRYTCKKDCYGNKICTAGGLNPDLEKIQNEEAYTEIAQGAGADNNTISYNQTQYEGIYTASKSGSSCCSGGYNGVGLKATQLKRHYTSRKGGLVGDFGIDQSSNYDYKLRFMEVNGSTIADIDTPDTNFSRRLVDGRDGDPKDGVFHDQLNGAVSELVLLDANGQYTSFLNYAKSAVLYTLNRNSYHFEIIKIGTDYAGRLSAVKDRKGYGINIKYKSFTEQEIKLSPERQWQRDTVTDAVGRVTRFEYHTGTIAGNYVISKVTLPNGKAIRYNYKQDTLNKVTYPDYRVSTYEYIAEEKYTRLLTNEVDGTKKEIFLVNNIVGSIVPGDQETSHGVKIWNQSSLLLKSALVNDEVRYHITTSSDSNLRIVYNGKGKVKEIHEGWWARYFNGKVTLPAKGKAWIYSKINGSKESKFASWKGFPHKELNRNTPSTLFDKFGRQYFYKYEGNKMTRKTYPDGTFESWQYNQFRQVLRYRDRLGRVTRKTYDKRGNLLSREVGLIETAGTDKQTNEYAVYRKQYYWSSHQNKFLLRFDIDANGNKTEYIYNKRNLLVSIKEPNDTGTGKHTASSFTYDSRGRQTSSTDAVGRKTTFSYDNRERLRRKTYNDGSTELFFYGKSNATGNLLVKYKDRNGNVTKNDYDRAGRLVKRITGYSIMDSSGKNEVLVTNGKSSVMTCSYVDGSNRRKSCNTNGDWVDYHYDFRRRMVGQTSYPNASTELRTSTIYLDNLVFASEDAYGRKSYNLYRSSDNALIRTVQGTVSSFELANFAEVKNLQRASSTNADYLITDYIKDAEGQTLATIDPRGIRQETQYDSRGRVVKQIADANGLKQTTEMIYDRQSNVIQVRNPRYFSEKINDRTLNTYTRRNLLKSRTVAAGSAIAATEHFTYYLDRRPATHTDFRGNTTVTEWHKCCGRFQAAIDPQGHARVENTDFYGNVTHSAVLKDYVTADMGGTDQQSVHNLTDNKTMQEVTTLFDARHRPIARTVWLSPLGAVDANNVPIFGNPGAPAGKKGLTTRMIYFDEVDGHPELAPLVKELAADGISFDAESDGSAVITINPAGEVSVSLSDGLGRTVASGMYNKYLYRKGTYKLHTWSTVGHDKVVNGLLETSSTSALGNKNKSYSDGAGRTLKVTDAENKSSFFEYDANSNQVSSVDANGVGMTCRFDNLNRDIYCEDTKGDVTRNEFDLNNNLTVQIDAKSNRTSCSYDERNRKIACEDRNAGTTSYSYDKNNNLIAIKDALNNSTAYQYDERNLEVKVTYADSRSTSCSYDALRRKKRSIDQIGDSVTYIYDLASRLLKRQYRRAGKWESQDVFTYDPASRLRTAKKGRYANTVSISYDAIGRKSTESLTYAGKTYKTVNRYDRDNRNTHLVYPSKNKVNKAYTKRNQLANVYFNAAPIITSSYDAGMRESSRKFGNGVKTINHYLKDNTKRKIEFLNKIGSRERDLTFIYKYDANKNVKEEKSYGDIMKTYQWTASFDDEDRVIDWNRINSSDRQRWDLDLIGNWKNTEGSLNNQGFNENRSHNNVHELTKIAGQTLSYDDKGNLTKDAYGKALSWDIDNHLRSFGNVSFKYDALGRRLEKSQAGVATIFISNGNRVLEEYSKVGDSVKLERSYVHGSYIDDMVAKVEAQKTPELLYYHSDRQYNVRGLTGQDGKIKELYAYSVYGQQTVMNAQGDKIGTSAYDNNYGFTGRYLDKETRLWYFRARYFNDEMGRFISRDPLGYVDGMSLYAGYFAEHFIMDPSGNKTFNLPGKYEKLTCPEGCEVESLPEDPFQHEIETTGWVNYGQLDLDSDEPFWSKGYEGTYWEAFGAWGSNPGQCKGKDYTHEFNFSKEKSRTVTVGVGFLKNATSEALEITGYLEVSETEGTSQGQTIIVGEEAEDGYYFTGRLAKMAYVKGVVSYSGDFKANPPKPEYWPQSKLYIWFSAYTCKCPCPKKRTC